MIIRDADFNWGKPLTAEEIAKLHSIKKIAKDKGKGKRSSRMDDEKLEERENELLRDFHLNNISIDVQKVLNV